MSHLATAKLAPPERAHDVMLRCADILAARGQRFGVDREILEFPCTERPEGLVARVAERDDLFVLTKEIVSCVGAARTPVFRPTP